MKKIRVIFLLLVFAISLLSFSDSVQAKSKRKPAAAPTGRSAISEKNRPWKGIPWVIGGVLSAGAVAVGLKNSKRTHLD